MFTLEDEREGNRMSVRKLSKKLTLIFGMLQR